MKLLILSLFLGIGIHSLVQAQSFRSLDKSPLDVAYLPDNFAHDRKPGEEAVIKVYYSRPQKNGRELFGKKVPYGKVWRTGANESVELTLFKDILLGENELKAGSYALFTIPGEKEWTIIINSDVNYWGAFSYNEKHDIMRFTVPVQSLPEVVEAFTIQFQDLKNNKAVMRLAWDQTMVEVPVGY